MAKLVKKKAEKFLIFKPRVTYTDSSVPAKFYENLSSDFFLGGGGVLYMSRYIFYRIIGCCNFSHIKADS